MRRRRRTQPDPEPKPELTPMIDIVFNLIIFFMIVSELSNLTVEELELAYADQAMKDRGQPERTLQVNVLADGRVRISGRTFALEPGGEHPPLGSFLAIEAAGYDREVSEDGGPPLSMMRINLRVDRSTPFEHVQETMDACVTNRIYKTSLAASPGAP